jgi:hypothetical protein
MLARGQLLKRLVQHLLDELGTGGQLGHDHAPRQRRHQRQQFRLQGIG